MDESHVIVYFKVDTDYHITSDPRMKFNDSKEVQRWLIKFYAVRDNGGIGKKIHDVLKILHFYIGLETKTKFSYENDSGRYSIYVKNQCGSSGSYIDIKGLYVQLYTYVCDS